MHISPWMTNTATFLFQLLILFIVAGFLVILRKTNIFDQKLPSSRWTSGRQFCCTSFMKSAKRGYRGHLFPKW